MQSRRCSLSSSAQSLRRNTLGGGWLLGARAVRRAAPSVGQLQHRPLLVSLIEEWVRPVMKRDKQVLLHWGYYPDR